MPVRKTVSGSVPYGEAAGQLHASDPWLPLFCQDILHGFQLELLLAHESQKALVFSLETAKEFGLVAGRVTKFLLPAVKGGSAASMLAAQLFGGSLALLGFFQNAR